MSRVSLLSLALACFFAAPPSWASQPDFHLQAVPANVYKVDDPGNTRTSSFVFDVAVICSSDCALTPISASVELSTGRSIVEQQEWTTELLAKIKGVNYRISPDTPVAFPRRMFTLPEAFDLHLYFRCPQALAVDSVDVHIKVADAKGRRTEQTLRIPVQFGQKENWDLCMRFGSPASMIGE